MNNFTINSSHQSFADKQKCLFDQLEKAEKQNTALKREVAMETECCDSLEQPDKREKNASALKKTSMKQYKSKDSIFKRPEAPIFRCLPVRRMPGFCKNPTKWTKYSLEDVREITDKSNTHAALSFLKELEEMNGKGAENERIEELPEKIVFKKSSHIRRTSACTETTEAVTSEEEKPSFRSSKLIMPEYVVGKSGKKEKVKKVKETESKEKAGKQLKLSHLDELDEDENNDV